METLAGAPGVAEHRFRAMGTDTHVVVIGGSQDLAHWAAERIEALEARWSRFRPDSELCRINRAAGDPVLVHPLTFELLTAARDAWARTGGAFDPTVLRALIAAGYDRDFDALTVDWPRSSDRTGGTDVPSVPGCAELELDPVVGAVRLPIGVELDLGGIAKGFTADVVARELLEAGAAGACVNLGGDLRVVGDGPSNSGAWVVAVEAEVDGGGEPVALGLANGGVATTSVKRRTWNRDDELHHHVIDPRTGRSARTPWAAATIVAGSATAAEPLAKAVLLASTLADARAVADRAGVGALVVAADGTQHALASMHDFLTTRDDLAISLKSPGSHLHGAFVPSGQQSARPRSARHDEEPPCNDARRSPQPVPSPRPPRRP
jgi:thiamine biosynthesis lipoprotein